jgi:hypothetical protein
VEIEYNWSIKSLECYPEKDGFTDVVFNVYWCLSGDDSNNKAQISCQSSISLDKHSTYIPFEDLTEEIIVNWVIETLGEDEVEKFKLMVNNQLLKKANPVVMTKRPPWVSEDDNIYKRKM